MITFRIDIHTLSQNWKLSGNYSSPHVLTHSSYSIFASSSFWAIFNKCNKKHTPERAAKKSVQLKCCVIMKCKWQRTLRDGSKIRNFDLFYHLKLLYGQCHIYLTHPNAQLGLSNKELGTCQLTSNDLISIFVRKGNSTP